MKSHIELRLTILEFDNLANYLTGRGVRPAVLRRIVKKIAGARERDSTIVEWMTANREKTRFTGMSRRRGAPRGDEPDG